MKDEGASPKKALKLERVGGSATRRYFFCLPLLDIFVQFIGSGKP